MSDTVAWHAGVPSDFRALAWKVFFTSRGRGISLAHHFPWVDDVTCTACVCARTEDGLVGGLVIRRVPMADGGHCGLIGLVCVDESARGLGWTHRLLDVAVAQAQQQGIAALLLWTQKPEVYARHGFVCDGAELLGEVVNEAEPASMPGQSEQPWPPGAGSSAPGLRGLPAFAQSARHLRVETARGMAQAIVLETAGGLAVAEWHGDEDDVARLLLASLPPRWTCNAIEGDRLVDVLQHWGCTMQLRQSRARFVRWLTPDTDRALPDVRVLDRI
jgi:GNAT superfamily N-acetyltransferase